MQTCRGTHGTSITRAKKIEKIGGFSCSRGTRGTGVYFWKESDYAKELAVGWYKYSYFRKAYKGEPEQGCAVVYAEMCVNEDEILPFDLIKEALAKRLQSSGYGANLNPITAAGIYDLVIEETEKILGLKFKIFETQVGLSKSKDYFPFYPIVALNSPEAYIVRFPDCIVIQRIERVPNV